MNIEDKYLVYENWRAEKKAVVHKSVCVSAEEGNIKITENWLINNTHPNDRWFGYFKSLEEAIAFASLLPNRQMKICKRCLDVENQNI